MSASGILGSKISQQLSSIPLAVKLGGVVVRMKTIDEVLVQKELELAKVGRELDALRIVAPLLRGEEPERIEAVETDPALLLRQATPRDESDVDTQPAFISWWERWRHETATHFFPVASLRKRL